VVNVFLRENAARAASSCGPKARGRIAEVRVKHATNRQIPTTVK
jgi:hypothetical protein